MEVFTVSQLTRRIRSLLEFEIGGVWVEGEISNHRLQTSGHQYFTLKDAGAQITCVYFRGQARFNQVALRDGAKVRVFGELSVYEARGQYQLIARQVTPVGAGRLFEAFEALKEKLRQEGLFDPQRKRPTPAFPTRIGLITSPTGAVIQDFLSILQRRAPWVEVFVCPVRVQGEGASSEIVEALEFLADEDNGLARMDCLVLARGGGSLEDLWAFNEESLARAIAACPLPVISAVGHETDFSIADFVADLRAPTPSAAAELVAPDGERLRESFLAIRGQLRTALNTRLERAAEQLSWRKRELSPALPLRRIEQLTLAMDDFDDRMARAWKERWRGAAEGVERAAQALLRLSPKLVLERHEERLGQAEQRLRERATRLLEQWKERLESRERQIRALGPDATIARGFALVLDQQDRPVASSEQVDLGQILKLRMKDGTLGVQVQGRSSKP